MKKYIMSLDQGTTSSRCILFDTHGRPVSSAQREFPQIFPREGWVEHDPMIIWSTQLSVATEALSKIDADWSDIHGIGITNQRETTVVWNRKTGAPIYNAIVWQCRRTADKCEELKALGYEKTIREKTGLLIDPYFSATKLQWVLDNIPCARELAESGELCFGTIDSWLIWKLTGGKAHLTDMTNAARTMLYNIHSLEWDEELLRLFDIPRSVLPAVLPSSALFGNTDPQLIGAAVPIAGVAGDQQAALFGQCCFSEGDIKNTYGTGAFLLMNTGATPYTTDTGLLTTIAYATEDTVAYALEGSIFTCGAAIQWLRDGLKIIESASDSEKYASEVPDSGGVMVVPAFTGLGAPRWDPYARGIIIGITRATTRNHIIRATLESLAYQTADVVHLMEQSTGISINRMKVDGGASANKLLLSVQSDILGICLERPECIETTALGAAYLCGVTLGIYSSLSDIVKNNAQGMLVTPGRDDSWRKAQMKLWRKATDRACNWAED